MKNISRTGKELRSVWEMKFIEACKRETRTGSYSTHLKMTCHLSSSLTATSDGDDDLALDVLAYRDHPRIDLYDIVYVFHTKKNFDFKMGQPSSCTTLKFENGDDYDGTVQPIHPIVAVFGYSERQKPEELRNLIEDVSMRVVCFDLFSKKRRSCRNCLFCCIL